LDVARHEIADTYYLSFSSPYTITYDAAVWGDSVVVATVSGLYYGNTRTNLLDAAYWSEMPFIEGQIVSNLVHFQNTLFALTKNGIVYQKNNSGWTELLRDPNATSISVQEDYLFICANTKTYMYNASMELQDVESLQNNSIALDSQRNLLFVASGSMGLSILSKINTKYSVIKDSILPEGPSKKTAWNSFFQNGVYYSTTGGRWGDRYLYEGDILTYKDEKWSNLKNRQEIANKTGLYPLDFMNLAIDPRDEKHFFITSWGEGLYEFRDSTFYKLHNNKNSPLFCVIFPEFSRYVRVDGATFDADNNLWMLTSNADTVLQILKPDGSWYSPFYAQLPKAPSWNSILFTSNNQVWMNSLRVNAGIFVLDNNQTLENTSDDQKRWFSSFTDQDGITISPYTVNCMAEDLNGSIWIGTVKGPIIANSPSNIFKSNYNFSRIKIPRKDGSGNADYLLNDIRINCIAVDGANRKWIGTNGNGLYLVSADGLETVHHFTMENSPLPSEYIWSIAIHPQTGEVFVGTEVGLVSYRSDATKGAEVYQNVRVFPNPVKPEYTGKITVTGLMANSQVKITDLAGNILIGGTSLGGQFSWNGYTKQGKRAASGVYLVLSASEDGTESEVCKFMIVR